MAKWKQSLTEGKWPKPNFVPNSDWKSVAMDDSSERAGLSWSFQFS
jgi:hypothetical protein